MKLFAAENISNLKNSDGEDFLEFLYKKYYSELCRTSFKYIGNEQIAEETVQDIFVNIWNKRFEIDITTSLKSYIYKSVINASINYVKSKIARIKKNENSIEDFENGKSFVDEEMDKLDLEQVLYKAINKLPEKCRNIFSLNRFAGLTQKEIAVKMEISIKTVETQIAIALKKLKVELEKYGYFLLIIGIFV